jgi:hypothetical protein
MNILVVPDAHSKKNVKMDRFTWLGNYIVDTKPDIIVCLGDFADMEALSSWDYGKKSFEGRRYKEDIKAAIEAQEALFKPLTNYNLKAKENHKPRYKPYLVMTLGNHEHRINRAVNDDPKLDGTIGIDDLKYSEFGWDVYPYKEVVMIEGIAFSHVFPNGLMDRPISGDNAGRTIIKKTHTSAIAGHAHILNIATEVNSNGDRLWGILAGCFLGEGQEEDYVSKLVQKSWWHGLTLLKNCNGKGNFDPEFISRDELKKKYSNI